MSAGSPFSLGRLHKFYCWNCGGREAYHSRPRGFFEKRILPLMLLKPVRCDRCFRRVYVLRNVDAMERVVFAGKPPQGEKSPASAPGTRIA